MVRLRSLADSYYLDVLRFAGWGGEVDGRRGGADIEVHDQCAVGGEDEFVGVAADLQQPGTIERDVSDSHDSHAFKDRREVDVGRA